MDRQPKLRKMKLRKDDGQVINAYNTICNVTEAGDVPVSTGVVPIWLCHKDNP